MSDFFKPATEAPAGARVYTFYEDPGHGWLEVKRTELKALGIAGDITHYSYLKDDTVFLEEDCDLSTFLRAKETRNEVVFYRRVFQEDTPIRYFDSYTALAA